MRPDPLEPKRLVFSLIWLCGTGRCSRVLTATQLQTVPQKSLGPSLRPAVQPVRVSLSRTKSRSASRTLQVLAAAAQKEVASDKPKVVVLGTGLMGEFRSSAIPSGRTRGARYVLGFKGLLRPA